MPDDTPAPFDPRAAGWKPMRAEGYPALIGPFWARREEGRWAYGFLAEARHRNDGGVVHGGMLMSFADDVLGITVWEAAGRRPCTTVQLNTHFIAPARLGDFVEGRAEVLRVTRSVVFVRGVLTIGGRTAVAADGVWKILGTG
ncbi:PaaI family thioesterase [Crenalkalicoccus roseus]|uniref:PaaI family thioesterase n=1 Tax=Crenalkalicoccus roseus TaxID=1485588 RepID=UPI001080D64B|nr:PaaI family thioesterase [Crenalkalicoccus roseus]